MAETYRRLFLASARQFAHLLVCANRKCVTLSFYCIRGLCAKGNDWGAFHSSGLAELEVLLASVSGKQ